MPWIDRCVKIVLDTLYPIYCPLCGQPGETGICVTCQTGLARIEHPCPRCGANFSGPGECGSCQINTPHYDLTFAPFRYEPPLSHLIQRLKYQRRIGAARHLAALLSHSLIQSATPRPELLIPVPLHFNRLMWRGFNQSVELGRYLSSTLQIPLDRTLAYRNRSTRAQTTMRIKQRKRNVKDCFDLCRPLQAKSVAIIDDVVTSGETVNELARVLREHGAALIQVWAPLRTQY